MGVRRALVPDAALTRFTAAEFIDDGSSAGVPEAEVYISSPYFTGRALVNRIETQL